MWWPPHTWLQSTGTEEWLIALHFTENLDSHTGPGGPACASSLRADRGCGRAPDSGSCTLGARLVLGPCQPEGSSFGLRPAGRQQGLRGGQARAGAQGPRVGEAPTDRHPNTARCHLRRRGTTRTGVQSGRVGSSSRHGGGRLSEKRDKGQARDTPGAARPQTRRLPHLRTGARASV